jgi:hypothetical protein
MFNSMPVRKMRELEKALSFNNLSSGNNTVSTRASRMQNKIRMRRCEARDLALQPGAAVKITHPIGDTEKYLIDQGVVDFNFVRFTGPGTEAYAVCREKGYPDNPKWILHPESLSVKEER